MKITEIRLYEIRLPISGVGYQLSRGRLVTATDNTIVEIVTDRELSGWGESCPFGPNYLVGFAGGARAALRELAPVLIGRDPREVEVINELMDDALSGHIYAKSAIDIACWDVLGRSTRLPLYILLGGMLNPDPIVRTGVTAAGGADISAGVAAKRQEGYRVFSLKLGDDAVADAELTRAVAGHVQAGELVVADANGGWRLRDAMTFVHMISDLPGILIEQPCQTIEDCIFLAGKADQPIILDESIEDLPGLAKILSDKAVAAVNLKIERIGGLTKTRQLRDLCTRMGCAMFIQEVGGAEITHAATTHLAHTIPADLLLGATTIKVTVSTADDGPRLENGRIRCNDRPGLGLTINHRNLGDPTVIYK